MFDDRMIERALIAAGAILACVLILATVGCVSMVEAAL